MTIQSEVEVKQVRIVQGTGEQISKAKSSGEILDTDLVIQTDAPELQEKIDDLDTIRSNANLGAVASSELPAVRQTAETAESIARGKARSQVFDTKTAMETWLKSADHKGELSVGDNLYIKAKDTPDYWISEVLTTKDPTTQYWYKISELEAEKPDISNMVTTDTQQTISGKKTFESRIYYGSEKPERELPEGYTQVQWINVAGGSTGANKVYLDTGIKIDHTIEFDVLYDYNNVGVGVASGQGVVMGARVSSSSWVCTVSGYTSFPTGYFGFNNNLRSQAYLMVGNNHISFRTPADNPNVGVYTCVNENGTNTYQINRVSGYPTTAPTLTLGCLHDGSNFSENLNGKIYYAKIWKNGELVRDYTPCVSDLTGEVGFYDFVSNTFNKSATNIPFSAGDGYVDQFALLSEVRSAVAVKQNKLTAGANISIIDNTISASIPSTYVTTNTAQTISGNKNFTGTLQKSGVSVATTTDVSTAVSNHNNDANAHDGIKQDVSNLQAKVEQIELFKFPNAIIRGTPTIQNGQISDFSTVSYLQFPFLIDFQDNAFQVDFCFTTSTNVQTQQNIIDSNFGIALAIKDGKGLMAISSNGTNWNIGSAVGTIAIQPNTTYYARLLWNKLQYKTLLSTDGQTYTQDMVLTGATRPYPRTAFIGGCNQEETGHTPHPFLGTINMNKAFLYINNQLIWQGMDDAGLSTRADVSLNNLDAEGEARFTAKQDVISDLATIRTGAGLGATALQSINSSMVTDALGYTPANSTDLTTHTGNGTIHVTANDKVAWSNKQNAITSNNKLSADLISDGTTNKAVTQTEKDFWNSKLSSIDSSMVVGALGYTPALGSDLDSHVNNTVMHVTSNERNTWNNKQSALVSGSNIKTINGNSILGSGNLSVTVSVTYDATNKRIKF